MNTVYNELNSLNVIVRDKRDPVYHLFFKDFCHEK